MNDWRHFNVEPYSERLSGGEKVKISSSNVHTKGCAKEANSECSFVNECSKRITCRVAWKDRKKSVSEVRRALPRKFNNKIKVADHDNFVSLSRKRRAAIERSKRAQDRTHNVKRPGRPSSKRQEENKSLTTERVPYAFREEGSIFSSLSIVLSPFACLSPSRKASNG